MDTPHYIDWHKSFDRETNTSAVYRPVVTEVEKHYHIELLGDSKTQYLVGHNGSAYDGKNGRPALFGHFYERHVNVPESTREKVIASAKDRLSTLHGVSLDDIQVVCL